MEKILFSSRQTVLPSAFFKIQLTKGENIICFCDTPLATKTQFKIVSVLNCLLCIDTSGLSWVRCLFNAWMIHGCTYFAKTKVSLKMESKWTTANIQWSLGKHEKWSHIPDCGVMRVTRTRCVFQILSKSRYCALPHSECLKLGNVTLIWERDSVSYSLSQTTV